jgi:hypothetical protein
MFKPILKAMPAFILSIVVLTPPATAQVFEIRTKPAVVQPFVRVMPNTHVYTVPQKFISVPASTVTRSVLVVPGNSPKVTTTISTTLTKLPDFAKRLANMKDQINLGANRGWLTAGELGQLNIEHDRLANLLRSHEIGGLNKAEIDDLEKQLTLFNQVIASELNDSESAVAGTRVVPY